MVHFGSIGFLNHGGSLPLLGYLNLFGSLFYNGLLSSNGSLILHLVYYTTSVHYIPEGCSLPVVHFMYMEFYSFVVHYMITGLLGLHGSLVSIGFLYIVVHSGGVVYCRSTVHFTVMVFSLCLVHSMTVGLLNPCGSLPPLRLTG